LWRGVKGGCRRGVFLGSAGGRIFVAEGRVVDERNEFEFGILKKVVPTHLT